MKIDFSFYKKILFLAAPIVTQNLLTNLASLLDNVMVGQTGTAGMSGVSVVNQIIFVYNLCVYGAVSGAGIFTAQFFGKGDGEGIAQTHRAKIMLSFAISFVAILVFLCYGDFFIKSFLHDPNSSQNLSGDFSGNANATFLAAKEYLSVMLWGFFPFALSTSYANTLRASGETSLPMKAGIAGVALNLCLNWILIFGKMGFPALGVKGAAIATVAARFLEAIFVVFGAHLQVKIFSLMCHGKKSSLFSISLFKKILVAGFPLALNETFWALGLTLTKQCYSRRGLSVIAALNISSTIENLFNVVLFALSEALAIEAGRLLGAKNPCGAKQTAERTLIFSAALCALIGFLMGVFRKIFPAFYATEDHIKNLASYFILISSAFLPVMACVHGAYFTLRAGGRTFLTFLFDSVFVCFVTLPIAFCLVHFTALPILPIFAIVSSLDLIKCAIGITLVKKGVWIKNLVE